MSFKKSETLSPIPFRQVNLIPLNGKVYTPSDFQDITELTSLVGVETFNSNSFVVPGGRHSPGNSLVLYLNEYERSAFKL